MADQRVHEMADDLFGQGFLDDDVDAARAATGRRHIRASAWPARDVGTDRPDRTVTPGSVAANLAAVRSRLEAHLGSRQVARVTYGAIIGLALIVALQAHPPGPGTVAGLILATGIAVGFADVYSEVIGVEVSEHHRVRRDQVAQMAQEASAVGFGVGFPALFFVLAAVHLLEEGTAFTIARWTGLGLIGLYGFLAARFAGAPVHRAVWRAAVVTAIGAALIAVKSLLH